MLTQPRRKSASFITPGHSKLKQRKPNIQKKLSSSKSVYISGQHMPSRTISRTNVFKEQQKLSITQRQSSLKKKNHQDPNKTTVNNKPLQIGQSYKQAIQKRKRKNSQSQPNSYKKAFNEQLLSTIDTFQQTLCSLPLDKLILSENPFYWVQEQIKTLQRLKDKFFRVQKTLKQQTRGYYLSKLQNVTSVLINIKDNLQTLSKMSLLKNYTSGGTSLNSRNSQSSSSLGWKSVGFQQGKQSIMSLDQNHHSKIAQNDHRNSVHTQWKGPASPHFSIQQNGNNKQNLMNYANCLSKRSNNQKIYKEKQKCDQISQKDQFILKEYQSECTSQEDVRIITNCKTQKSLKSDSRKTEQQYKIRDKEIEQNFQAHNFRRQNYGKQTHSGYQHSNEMFKKKQQNNMNKTVSKYQQKHEPLRQSFSRKYVQQESKETFNTLYNDNFIPNQSIQLGEQTKRCYPLSLMQMSKSDSQLNEFRQLQQELSMKNELLITLENRHQKFIRTLQSQFAKKQKHYLTTIYDLKQQCEEKERSIKKLLIQKEQQSQHLELAMKQLKQALKKGRQQSSTQNILQKSIESLTNQLKQSKIREQELRQTVQLQRQRTKKALKEIEQHQTKIQQLFKEIQLKQEEIQNMKTQSQANFKKYHDLSLQLLKIKEKQDIYRIKYFRLYAEFDQFKQKVADNAHFWNMICLSCKKQYTKCDKNDDPQKQLELRQLINFHKKQLLQP